jgi:hypothetical protein
MRMAFTGLRQSGTRIQTRRPQEVLCIESLKQSLGPAIPNSYPQQLRCIAWSTDEKIKILVFAHQNQVIVGSILPDNLIVSFLHSEITDMLSGVSVAIDKPGKRRRQLVINEKLHFI